MFVSFQETLAVPLITDAFKKNALLYFFRYSNISAGMTFFTRER